MSLGLLPPMLVQAQEPTGEEIYQRRCAACHGADGEGTAKKHPHPLAGERSVTELAGFIAKSMPADAPGDCSPADAERVAAYIHDTFYSRQARDRHKPPLVELTHLTAHQYRLAVADLIASFRNPGQKEARRIFNTVPQSRLTTPFCNDPCHLAWQVNEILWLESSRLVRPSRHQSPSGD